MKPEDKLGTLEEAIEFDKKRNYQYTTPVGWWNENLRIHWQDAVLETKEDGWDTPLYTAPRELSDEEIKELAKHYIDSKGYDVFGILEFAKAILKKASEK